MLRVTGLGRNFGGRAVLDEVSFGLNQGELLGVVGPNGSGKSTLLRLLAGRDVPDRGVVSLEPGAVVGYLEQGFAGRERETAMAAFPHAFAVDDAAVALERLGNALAVDADGQQAAALMEEYDRVVERLAAAPAVDSAAARVALGLAHISAERPVGSLSGGELTRLGLLNLLAGRADLLLLDEPTNNLDSGGLEWLEATLATFRGAVTVVSHDRRFLDACATQILVVHAGGNELFAGNYSGLLAEKARRAEAQATAYERQQREEGQLRQAIHRIETRAKGIENATIDFAKRKKALKIARRAVTLKARLERELESVDHVARPENRPSGFHGRVAFAPASSGPNRLVSVEKVALDAGGRRLFEALDFAVHAGECVMVTGANGRGKTTLLRAVMGQHPVAGGTISVSGSAAIGYLAQQDDPAAIDADRGMTPVELVRRKVAMTEAEATNFLHRFLLGHDQVRTPLARLSYGERRRLSLAVLVRSGANLLVLDEPTNHLDLPSREAFEAALEGFDGAILAVSHDRAFVERFADVVVEL